MKAAGLAAFWLAVAALFFYYFNHKINPNTVDELGDAPSVTLQRDLSSHYRAEVLVNGVKASALVDTGATSVSISRRLADQLGIQSNVAIRLHTANGDSVGYMARLDSVKLGGIEVHDVAATIVPNLDGDLLLGMSFLNRMDVRLYKGTMTLRQVAE
ncbi:MAG: retroviral-like aspartic protease family protein [Gallionellaceae bacterium]|jgi:aspartyl protease family protein|nr:retroviral-like aspartic protease family protein [Gallionellaceae bacterium]